MKNKTIFGLFALAMLVVSIGAVSAFRWGNSEQVKQALDSKDFGSWKQAMSEQLTEENFNQMAERHGKMVERHAAKQEMREALEAGDFEAWKAAVENMPRKQEVSEEDFNVMVQMHQARQDGDFDKAMELREELGFKPGFGRDRGCMMK